MNNNKSNTIPIWVFLTLILNCVFGLPGGDSAGTDITLGSLESMVNLALNVERGPSMDLVDQEVTPEAKWQCYIEAESHRR